MQRTRIERVASMSALDRYERNAAIRKQEEYEGTSRPDEQARHVTSDVGTAAKSLLSRFGHWFGKVILKYILMIIAVLIFLAIYQNVMGGIP